LHLRAGEVVGLLGPNGAGKTTTFHMILGFLRPDGGRVWLNGADITYLPVWERASRGLGFLPQEPSVFRKLTVEGNILAILETLDLDRREREQRLRELIKVLDLEHLASAKAYTLSGGERRRVEITRAITTSPAFLLLDEPFAGLDPIAVSELQRIMARLKKWGIGLLITDHNVRECLKVVDRAYLIYEGKVLLFGSAQELASDERAREIYLGAQFHL
ncbi:MAG: LPS export ABC transporter ATP-binding protein, partial [candidate division NC10 bacterium]|nr:LPS export ABC transporter ATP-binding protein [candidate division NC10 bacterium]